ncbi:hypothetical protein K501DRAFT_268312 [Backusella circina FSU 941]|nr:hypothetical protein K501DRAFT_268312 [Backusella circina FSU 941]
MFDNLPHETILHISSYLCFYDKLKLSNTCHNVRRCLVDTVLYENLTIPSKHVDGILHCFKSNDIDSSQVKTLHIEFPVEKENRFYELPAIFPKLREIYTGACTKSSGKVKLNDAERIKSMNDKLRVYDTRDCHKAVLLLINKYRFNRITNLHLESSFFRSNNKFKLDIFQCISNTPSLATLCLEKFQINLDFFEKMHANNSSIRVLKLRCIKLVIDETELSQMIPPYRVLEALEITCGRFIDRDLLFVNYLVDKYLNLNSLDIDSWMLIARASTPDYHSVSTYRNYRPVLADRILPLVARLDVLKIEPKLFENFFDSVGPSISHLTGIGIYSSKDKFTMFKNMKELNFIRSLPFLTSLSVEAKHSNFLYNKKVTIPNIRHLNIFGKMAFCNRSIALDKLLFTYNGLETLELKCKLAKIVVDATHSHDRYRNLQTLTLEAAEITPDVNKYLTDCLPNIKELYWKSLDYPSHYTFNLPNHSIHVLNICTIGYGGHSYFNQRMNCKTCYTLITQHDQRLKYFINIDPDIKKVKDQDDDEIYNKVINVEVNCRDAWELKNGDVVIF